MRKRGYGRLLAVLLLGVLAAASCTDPVGVEHTISSGNHTISSGNHTTSSGNHTTSSGNLGQSSL